jgi:opacity protein-like surface antigen
MFGAAAGPVRKKAELQQFFDIIVERLLAGTRVDMNGGGTSTTVSATISNPPGGAAGTSNTAGTGTLSGTSDTLDNRWLVSVLARAGYLVDPSDHLHVVGGYTYGRFENQISGFGMNGGTIGIGWEKRIFDGWNLRAEYRYTRFASNTVNLSEPSSSTSSTTGATPGSGTLASSLNAAFRFSDVDMHSFWLGVSYNFGP